MKKFIFYLIILLCLFLSYACDKNDKSINSYVYPQIISTIPTANATNIPTNIIIAINYDTLSTLELLKPITLSIDNIETSVSYTENSVYFKLNSILEYNKSYTVTVHDALDREFSFQFLTSNNLLPDFPEVPDN